MLSNIRFPSLLSFAKLISNFKRIENLYLKDLTVDRLDVSDLAFAPSWVPRWQGLVIVAERTPGSAVDLAPLLLQAVHTIRPNLRVSVLPREEFETVLTLALKSVADIRTSDKFAVRIERTYYRTLLPI